ncbi:FAD-dependent oxidoreductase [Pelomyxa schiedti]|nr:FAD-dependent oxidoreductase [Pelomyxa schiedti]
MLGVLITTVAIGLILFRLFSRTPKKEPSLAHLFSILASSSTNNNKNKSEDSDKVDKAVASSSKAKPATAQKPWRTWSSWKSATGTNCGCDCDGDGIDVIVIGSGSSGLTAASILARAGKKVVVLEQHSVPGGCLHNFSRMGAEFDTGTHMLMGSKVITLVSDGATPLDWPSDSPREVMFIGDKQFIIPNGKGSFVPFLVKTFPHERQAISTLFKYAAAADNLAQIHAAYMCWNDLSFLYKIAVWLAIQWSKCRWSTISWLRHQSFEDLLNKLTTEKPLKDIVAVIPCGCMSTPASAMPALSGLTLVNALRDGYCFPSGGTSRIIRQLCSKITENGGMVVTGASVTKLSINEGKCNGVYVGDTFIRSQAVVCSTGIDQAKELAAGNVILPVSDLDLGNVSGSAFSTFVVLDAPARALSLPPVLWIMGSDGHTALEDTGVDKILARTAALVAFEETQKSNKPDENACLGIYSLCGFSDFTKWSNTHRGSRPEDYLELKQKLQDAQLDILFSRYPHLKSHVKYAESATPLTYQDYLCKTSGCITGYSNGLYTQGQFPVSKVDGLFLCGQDLYCGVSGASVTGIIAAGAVLHRPLLLELAVMGVLS